MGPGKEVDNTFIKEKMKFRLDPKTWEVSRTKGKFKILIPEKFLKELPQTKQ